MAFPKCQIFYVFDFVSTLFNWNAVCRFNPTGGYRMFRSNTILTTVFVCLLLLACVAVLTEDAYAKDDDVVSPGADKKMATQEGLGSKEWDENQLPGKFEIGLALGSIVAMIGVIKFV